MEFLNDIQNAFLPEIIIFSALIFNIILSIFLNKKFYKTSKWVALSSVSFALIATYFTQIQPNYYAFKEVFLSDFYTMIFKNLILISSFLIIVLSRDTLRKAWYKSFDFFTLLLSAILACLFLVSSNDFLTMFVSLELLSLSCYFLTSISKNYKSKEAGLKYLISGSVASAFLLFGISYIYCSIGNLDFNIINDYLLAHDSDLLFTLGSLFFICGFMFKIGLFPFLNWVCDVYEGASYRSATFISTVPKIAGFAILIRILVFVFHEIYTIKIILALFAIISIVFASFLAIKQNNIKRFFGLSSIVNCGFILLGLSGLSVYAVSSVIFYIMAYAFMNIGIWACAILFTSYSNQDNISDYKGLVYSRPFYVMAFSFLLISLAGLPPSSGFLSKIYLFSAISRSGFEFVIFLIIALLMSVIGIFYYTKPIKIMFDRTKTPILINKKFISTKIIIYFCSLITFIFFVFADKIIELTQIASYYI